jgi:gliding motility-associated-like protein
MRQLIRASFILGLIFCSYFTMAQVRLNIVLDADGVTYKVYLKSDVSFSNNQSLIVTSQVTLVVPHGVGSDYFVPENIQSPYPNMKWRFTNRVDAPVENPDKDYLFFAFTNNQTPIVRFDIVAGQEYLLFSFRRKGNCIGKVALVEEQNDAFWIPNSQNVNVGSSLSIVGAGGNALRGNYDSPPSLKVTADRYNICAGTKLNFTATPSGNVAGAKYQWFVNNQVQNGANGLNFSYDVAKNMPDTDLRVSLKMTIDNSDKCNSYSTKAQAMITVKGLPELEFVNKVENCVVLPTQLVIKSTPFADLQWEKDGQDLNGEKQSTLTISQNGKYRIKASINGCSNMTNAVDVIGVSSNSGLSVDAGIDTTVLEGEKLILKGNSTNAKSYEWSLKDDNNKIAGQNLSIIPTQTNTYTFTAKDVNGCPVSDDVEVKVIPQLRIPNAFTPNNDTQNDTWNIKNTTIYPEIKVEVFNRWGTKIFNSVGYQEAWDGTIQSQKVEIGTYLYKITTSRKTYSGALWVIY